MGPERVFSFLIFVETSLIRFFLGQRAIGTTDLGTHQGISLSGFTFLSRIETLLLMVAPSFVAISFQWLTGRMLGQIRIVSGFVSAGGIALGHDGSAIGLAD